MSAANGYQADDGVYGEPNRLDKESEEKLVQRLYYRQVELSKQREEERMATLRRSTAQASTKKVTKAEEEHLVDRMYDQQLQRFAASKEERERKMEEEAHKNDIKRDSADIEDQVKRMYDDELAKGRARREELDQRYYPKQETKKIPKAQLAEAVSRLYHVDYEKRDEELFQKYVYPFDPKSSRISKGDVEAMADRLSSTKGSA